MNEKKPWPSNLLLLVALLLGIISLLLLFVGPELVKSRLQDWHISTENPGQIGDIFGGTLGPFIAMIAAILTFAAFWVQYESNQDQKRQFKEQARNFALERFEGKFFDLLKIHRENVSQMKVTLIRVLDKETRVREEIHIGGHELIKEIVNQVLKCKEEITPLFSRKQLLQFYNVEYLDRISSEPTITKRKINLRHLAINDIAWCITFFGLDPNGSFVTRKNLEQKYQPNFIGPLITYLSLKPLEGSQNWYAWRKLKRSNNNRRKLTISQMIIAKRTSKKFESPFSDIELEKFYFKDDNQRFYCGFHLQIGHYFRHLYQTVNFINDQEDLSYKEKYNYAKTLRAQLSTLEQVVFYYNSLSSLGNIWELCVSKRFGGEFTPSENSVINKQLITKYNLIKNMPSGQLFKQEFEKFYPEVEFEFKEEKLPSGRNNLMYS